MLLYLCMITNDYSLPNASLAVLPISILSLF